MTAMQKSTHSPGFWYCCRTQNTNVFEGYRMTAPSGPTLVAPTSLLPSLVNCSLMLQQNQKRKTFPSKIIWFWALHARTSLALARIIIEDPFNQMSDLTLWSNSTLWVAASRLSGALWIEPKTMQFLIGIICHFLPGKYLVSALLTKLSQEGPVVAHCNV